MLDCFAKNCAWASLRFEVLEEQLLPNGAWPFILLPIGEIKKSPLLCFIMETLVIRCPKYWVEKRVEWWIWRIYAHLAITGQERNS